MQRRFLTLALPLLFLSWLFPPWTSFTQSQGKKEKAEPLGLGFLLAPPTTRGSEAGVEIDYGRLLLLDASLCVAGLALSQLTRRHVSAASRAALWTCGAAAICGAVAWIEVSQRNAAIDRRREARERERERAESRELSDEDALLLLQGNVRPAEMSPEEFIRGLSLDEAVAR